jgi:hypothetical protein
VGCWGKQNVSSPAGTWQEIMQPAVQIAIPTIVAFLFYEGLRLTARWNDLGGAYLALTKMFALRQWNNDLDILIQPHLSSL